MTATVVMTVVALLWTQVTWRVGILGGLLGLAVAASTIGVRQRWKSTAWAALAGVLAGVAVVVGMSFIYTGGEPNPNAVFWTSIWGAGFSAVISAMCLIGLRVRGLRR